MWTDENGAFERYADAVFLFYFFNLMCKNENDKGPSTSRFAAFQLTSTGRLGRVRSWTLVWGILGKSKENTKTKRKKVKSKYAGGSANFNGGVFGEGRMYKEGRRGGGRRSNHVQWTLSGEYVDGPKERVSVGETSFAACSFHLLSCKLFQSVPLKNW